MIGALRQVAPSPLFRLKYPNDVQALTREGWAKIGGTLVEHEYQGDRCTSTVVGLGVNIEQSKFADTIDQPCTSLYLLGSDVSLSSFMLALRTTMERVMRSSWQDMHTEWLRELNITGRTVQIKGEEGSWTVREVLPDGRLAVINDESHTERVLTNGDSVRYHDPIE
jgi:BirA family transcriptional regulator, biotin operon repressor / biotin---[acetyl-CoA-carboxylase] ligase